MDGFELAQQAYLKNSSATASAADLIQQSVVLKAINGSRNLNGQKVNDPAAMALAVGRPQTLIQSSSSLKNRPAAAALAP